MGYILGVDQGGSKTHAVIADKEGNILGWGESYGACHSSSSVEYAMKAVWEAANKALLAGGLLKEDIESIVGGITGVDWDYEEKLLEDAIREYFPKSNIRVVNDCIIAMRAGTMNKNCGILCAGSGLNCAVQSEEKRFVYGFFISDHFQGGACLGHRTLQAVFDSHMGITGKTALTEMVLQLFQTKSVEQLLYRQVKEKIKNHDYLSLPILLEKAALKGDAVASEIWITYGREMVVFLTARMREMKILDQNVDIVLSGSIFKCKYRDFQDTVKEEILKSVPKANIIEAEYEPVMGAVLMGIKSVTGQINNSVYEHLEAAANQFPIKRLTDRE